MENIMKVLVIGRGVVGTIYGWALSKAGAPRATFLLFTANWDGTEEIDRLLPRWVMPLPAEAPMRKASSS